MTRPKPITIDGVEYASRTAASEALGVSHQAICQRAKRNAPSDKGMAHPVRINGVVYPSKRRLLEDVAPVQAVTCDHCRFAVWRGPDESLGQCTWRLDIPVAPCTGIAGAVLTVQGGHIWRGFDMGCKVGVSE